MKNTVKIISLLFALTFMTGCANNADELQARIDENQSQSNPTLQAAVDLALAEAERLFPAESRSEIREVDIESVKIVGRNRSRSLDDTLIYVVNYKDEKGFALIAATEVDNPVLAIVPEGNYDPEIGTDNPGFNLFLDAAVEVCSGKPKASPSRIGVIERDSTDMGYLGLDGKYHKQTKKVLINRSRNAWTGYDLKWNQNGIYGKYCPNGRCGCVPLTIVTLMTYLRAIDKNDLIPSYSFPEPDVANEQLNFSEMFKHKSSKEINPETGYVILNHNCYAEDEVHNKIGRFLREVGYIAGSALEYGQNGTFFSENIAGAQYKDMYSYVRSNLSPYIVRKFATYNFEELMDALDIGLLFVKGVGHVWYCDAYNRCKMEITEYVSDDPKSGPFAWVYNGTTIIDKSEAWMHWGWGGLYDGWYDWNVLNPGYFKFESVEAALVEIPERLR